MLNLEKILYENWRNNQIYPSIFLVALQIPDINLFEKIYTFNVKGKNITLNLIYNDCFYKIDGFIFFCDLTNEESIEYILKKINAYKEYSLNKKSIIITYQGKKNKERLSMGRLFFPLRRGGDLYYRGRRFHKVLSVGDRRTGDYVLLRFSGLFKSFLRI